MENNGRCGAHEYPDYTQTRVDGLFNSLLENGFDVSGSNPWDVDTKRNGVKLRGSWDETQSLLSVIVTDKGFFVPCSEIWKRIDPLISEFGVDRFV